MSYSRLFVKRAKNNALLTQHRQPEFCLAFESLALHTFYNVYDTLPHLLVDKERYGINENIKLKIFVRWINTFNDFNYAKNSTKKEKA